MGADDAPFYRAQLLRISGTRRGHTRELDGWAGITVRALWNLTTAQHDTNARQYRCANGPS